MEWVSAVRKAIDFMEVHLKQDISVTDVAKAVYISSVHFQKGFSVLTGYSVSEYLRKRRLYQAALDLRNTDQKIIDLSYDYGYQTPESFTKAFTRFHGVTPTAVKEGASFKTFLPLRVRIEVTGGDRMDYQIKMITGFQLVGFARTFDMESAFLEIPLFWEEIMEKYGGVLRGKEATNIYEEAMLDFGIGEYALCIDDETLAGKGKCLYLIAGKYTGGELPEGMMLYTVPSGDFAVFDCVGPIPETIQSLSEQIFKEWLPGNPDYELRGNLNLEWYDPANGENTADRNHAAVWIPVSRKQ